MFTISKANSHAVAQPIAIQDIRPVEKMQNGKGWNDDGTSYTVDTHATQGVAQPMAFDLAQITSASNRTRVSPDLPASTLSNGSNMHMASSMAVRRLTPVECERLQGFPDRYTDIQRKGKATPDGPRYKALGNSMAVPVMAWIGKRIQEVDAICKTQLNK